jgi:hypothetical protein
MARLIHLAAALLLLLAAPLLMAMGMGGSEGPTRIPEPEQNYRAHVIDMEGVSVDLTNFSIDGQVFVLGNLGDGSLAVPFDKVKSIDLVKKGEAMKAHLTLHKEKPVDLSMKATLNAYGKTEYGNFRIALGQVKSIQLLGRVQ